MPSKKHENESQLIKHAVEMRKRAEEAEAHVGMLREALNEAIGEVESCCGCIYRSDEDGLVYAPKGHVPMDKINAALAIPEDDRG